MRLNKYLAQSGVDSRRKCDEHILAGKVKINGKVVKELGVDVNLDNDNVQFENNLVRIANKFVYYKLNKPKGYITSANDEKDRKTVLELMRGVHTRVFPIGRLDYNTEGLLLMTNDGDLANIFMSPKSQIEKTYVVKIEGKIDKAEIDKLKNGVDIGDDIVTKPCNIVIVGEEGNLTKLEVIITEGKNRQIRKMFETINKTITFLRRNKIGEINLGGLSRGEYKELNIKEMHYIDKIKSKYAK